MKNVPMAAKLAGSRRELCEHVVAGLGQRPKQLSPVWFYDALGSRLFDAICELPWYPITRAETALLRQYGSRMVAPMKSPTTLVELGCGNGDKVALLAEALRERGDVAVHLVDVSRTALEVAERALGKLRVSAVFGHRATYEAGLREASARRPERGSLLVAFLGSNVGNFEPAGALDLLREIRGALRKGDGLLLGADLVKPEGDLLLAYDDPLGVTAAFNKNVLARINRELDADFDLAAFAHRALWNERESRVEMHLVSKRRQRVTVGAADASFELREGETIWTESSYKYTPEGIVELGRQAGFRCHEQWIEPEAQFGSTLLLVG